MQKLNLPQYQFKFKMLGQITQIFDIVRKKYIALTPEEWVRQHMIHFLIHEKNFPASHIGVEKGIEYNGLKKRVDILIFDRNARPFMIVECKAPGVKISQQVFDQASIYNLSLKVKFMLVTNGLNHYCYRLDEENKAFLFIGEIPDCPKDF
jgi:hypothetical protein